MIYQILKRLLITGTGLALLFCMKKIILLPLLLFVFASCDSKKQSLIDSQKLINKKLTGLADSLNRVSDSASFYRIKSEIRVLQIRFDSLDNELDKFDK